MTQTAAPPRSVPYAVFQREQERRMQAEQFITWESQMFAHPALDAGDKIFLRTQKLVEMRQRPQIVDGHTVWRVDNDELSKGMGNHSSTVTSKYAKLEASGLISRVPMPYTLPSGESVTLMFGKLADVIEEPAKIEVPRTWGGKRTKKCLTCGGDLQTERHALVTQERTICDTCGEETVYAPAVEHPGFNAEIITDEQEGTITIRRKKDPEEATQQQKQDAFADEITHNEVQKPDVCEKPSGKKQDAFEQEESEKQDAFGPVVPASPLQLASPSPFSLVKQDAFVNPITPPHWGERLSPWLEKRIGDGRIIIATGKLEHAAKYIYKDEGYEPDYTAYLAGHLEHIYGSRPQHEEWMTYLLAFDNDGSATHDQQHTGYMTALAQAGIASLCWKRRPGRWHLEIYFDAPVDARAAYAWVISVCPELAEIPECYPLVSAKQALSWPFYYRIGRQVIPCAVEGMLPELPGELITHAGIRDTNDLRRLVDLIALAVTPAALIPPYTPPADPEPAAPEASRQGGVLLEEPSAVRFTGDDVRDRVLADANASLTWQDVIALCGGLENGHFKAVWRGERTASVKVDPDGRFACDYGNYGSHPRKLDKFGAWCLAKGLKVKEETKRRCEEYRERQVKRPAPTGKPDNQCCEFGCTQQYQHIGRGQKRYCPTHWTGQMPAAPAREVIEI